MVLKKEVATNYALSLSALITDNTKAKIISEYLKVLADELSTKNAMQIFFSPRIAYSMKKKLLKDILNEFIHLNKSHDIDCNKHLQSLTALLMLMLSSSRLDCICELDRLFAEVLDQRMSIKRATLTLASKQSDKTIQKITQSLEELLGYKLHLTVKIEPKIIAGFKFTSNNICYDGTLKNDLDQLLAKIKD